MNLTQEQREQVVTEVKKFASDLHLSADQQEKLQAFEENLRKNEESVREALATLRSVPKPGPFKTFCFSAVGMGRFLTSKAASMI